MIQVLVDKMLFLRVFESRLGGGETGDNHRRAGSRQGRDLVHNGREKEIQVGN